MRPRFWFFSKGISFVERQQRDWKVTVARTSLDKLAYQTVFPYLSIYVVALGATATQLGLVNTIGMTLAGIIAPFTGWFIDRTGPKNIYLLGISLVAISYLTYGIAQSWLITIIAMAAYWLGFSISTQSCATICGNCLVNEDRATGMTICETVAAGLLGMAGPMLGAWVVTTFGGINVSGIRPVFFFCLAISMSAFIIVLTQLSNKRWRIANVARPHIFHDLYQVLKEGHHLKRWLVIASVSPLPLAMVFPFSQLFAHQIKGATPFVLGAMVTGSALTSIAFAIPFGRLADRIGRKKILYMTIPLFWISNLLLVWSPNPAFLIAAGMLQGFHYIGGPISQAMERELVPREQMSRWIGIVRFFRMLLSAPLAFVCGVIWDRVGPQYVFLSFVVLDLVFRLPLLISMPETLGLRLRRQIPLSER
ncbi:MAG: MFS transporter [Chloroflexi bacterium]|nr:MFS transporter [Chloroflexota bacterium]